MLVIFAVALFFLLFKTQILNKACNTVKYHFCHPTKYLLESITTGVKSLLSNKIKTLRPTPTCALFLLVIFVSWAGGKFPLESESFQSAKSKNITHTA